VKRRAQPLPGSRGRWPCSWRQTRRPRGCTAMEGRLSTSRADYTGACSCLPTWYTRAMNRCAAFDRYGSRSRSSVAAGRLWLALFLVTLGSAAAQVTSVARCTAPSPAARTHRESLCLAQSDTCAASGGVMDWPPAETGCRPVAQFRERHPGVDLCAIPSESTRRSFQAPEPMARRSLHRSSWATELYDAG
jgi:hypothetical protein